MTGPTSLKFIQPAVIQATASGGNLSFRSYWLTDHLPEGFFQIFTASGTHPHIIRLLVYQDQIHLIRGDLHAAFSPHQHTLETTPFCANSEFLCISSVLSWVLLVWGSHAPIPHSPASQDTAPSGFCSVSSPTPSSMYKHTRDFLSWKTTFLNLASNSSTYLSLSLSSSQAFQKECSLEVFLFFFSFPLITPHSI